MYSSILLGCAALLARTVMAETYSAPGQVNVVNSCANPVSLVLEPASTEDFLPSSFTVYPGQSWYQHFIGTSSGYGWYVKLASGFNSATPLKFEYTWYEPGVDSEDNRIYWSVTCSEGEAFDSNWSLASTNTDEPPNQACYRYSDFDADGWQPGYRNDTEVTLTLCPNQA